MPLQMNIAAPMQGASALKPGKPGPCRSEKIGIAISTSAMPRATACASALRSTGKPGDRDEPADQKFPGPRRAHEKGVGGAVGAHQPDAERKRRQRQRAERGRQRDALPRKKRSSAHSKSGSAR